MNNAILSRFNLLKRAQRLHARHAGSFPRAPATFALLIAFSLYYRYFPQSLASPRQQRVSLSISTAMLAIGLLFTAARF